jgi:hypothetical protein
MEIEVATKHQGLILQNRWLDHQPAAGNMSPLHTQYSSLSRANVNSNMHETFMLNSQLKS